MVVLHTCIGMGIEGALAYVPHFKDDFLFKPSKFYSDCVKLLLYIMYVDFGSTMTSRVNQLQVHLCSYALQNMDETSTIIMYYYRCCIFYFIDEMLFI